MKIPVFHDDQHGTAIVVAAAILNGLQVVGKDIKEVKLVTSGAGAAALACLNLLVTLGFPRNHIWVTDLAGVVYDGRTKLMDIEKAAFLQKTKLRTLADVIPDADIFLGLSAGGVLKPHMVASMAPNPLIFALANPTQKSCLRRSRGFAKMLLLRPGAATTRIRSTMSSASPTYFAAPSMCGPARSTTR